MNPNPWIVSGPVTVTLKNDTTIVGISASIWFAPDNAMAHVQVRQADRYVEIAASDVLTVVHT